MIQEVNKHWQIPVPTSIGRGLSNVTIRLHFFLEREDISQSIGVPFPISMQYLMHVHIFYQKKINNNENNVKLY